MDIRLKAKFTRNAENVIANTARLHGVDEMYMIAMARQSEAMKDVPDDQIDFSQTSPRRIAASFTVLPPTCSVMFDRIVSARGGDSFVTSATISEDLARELALDHGERVDVMIDISTYSPDKGVAVKAAKRPENDEKSWILAAEFE